MEKDLAMCQLDKEFSLMEPSGPMETMVSKKRVDGDCSELKLMVRWK